MTDKATETEKALMKGTRSRLFGIMQRQRDATTTSYLFTILVVVGVLVVAALAIAAIQYL